MNKKLITIAIILLICVSKSRSQTIADSIAQKIAGRMMDSLSLSTAQRDSIYTINLLLHAQKTAARQQYAHSDSAATLQVQRIENSRDSLYRPVLGEEKYQLYRQKKRKLVNNN